MTKVTIMTKVFIVVLNWNGKGDTIECLDSIQKLKLKNIDCKIIVVDNASSDDSVAAVKNYKSKLPLIVLENPDNFGFAEGNNVGIRYALKHSADFIMILNNDTELDEDIITQLIKGAHSHPKAAILSPKIYFAKGYEFHKKRYKKTELGKVFWYTGGKIDWDNVYGSNRGVDEVDRGQYDMEESIDYATGACMFIRAKALKSNVLFNKYYFMYLEDSELCMRLKKLGWQIVYIPSAVVWHKVSQSSGIGSGLNDYFTTRNRMMFGMSYASFRTKVALVRESFRLLQNGREWQKKGILDFYLGRLQKGSWK